MCNNDYRKIGFDITNSEAIRKHDAAVYRDAAQKGQRECINIFKNSQKFQDILYLIARPGILYSGHAISALIRDGRSLRGSESNQSKIVSFS